jgi:hypothetical protein
VNLRRLSSPASTALPDDLAAASRPPYLSEKRLLGKGLGQRISRKRAERDQGCSEPSVNAKTHHGLTRNKDHLASSFLLSLSKRTAFHTHTHRHALTASQDGHRRRMALPVRPRPEQQSCQWPANTLTHHNAHHERVNKDRLLLYAHAHG